MSLQVWLPLTGHLKNQGLASTTITGTPAYGAGKVGDALDLINSAQITISCSTLNNVSTFSVAFWIKGTKDTSDTDWASPINFSANKADGTENSNFRFGKDNRASSTGYPVAMFNNDAYPISTNNIAFTDDSHWDKWVHICFTTNGSLVKKYVNGEFLAAYNYGTAGWLTGTIRLRATRYNGFLNDFRVYNHVLSDNEVKELSRGLALHFPLSRNNLNPYTGNLILNAFGEAGTSNWNQPSKVFTDDLPTANSSIKIRVTSGNYTNDFIPIYRNHSYSTSVYVKATQTTGSCYPSFIPYDIDKLQINYRNTKAGFDLNTMTTLKQQLKAGDTKIYVNSLSAWSTAANYYNYAAIFGYKDSTGYTYPDGVYTRNTPTFWSGNTTEKTSLDKTNNVITLSSAYDGETIPVGRSICQATAGSAYFYPWSGVANSGIADWTLKTTTFSSENNYLVAAKYLRFLMYSNGMAAGPVLKDITIGEENIEYDTSGYQRNGTRNGDLGWSTNTPKYDASTYFNGVNTSITTSDRLTFLNNSPFTVSFWANCDDWTTVAASAAKWLINHYNTTSGALDGFRIYTSSGANRYRWYWADSSGTAQSIYFSTAGKLVTGWHFFTATFDGSTMRTYLDGAAYTSLADTSFKNTSGAPVLSLGVGSSGFLCQMSDFRIYTTTLSAEDIQDLYNGLF